jgi:hypothetical protein
VPLHTPAVPAAQRGPFTRAAALAACAAAATVTIVIGDDQLAHADRSITKPSLAGARYFDIEANKAIAIRALGLRANEQTTRPSGYDDLEANKARTAQAR